MKKLITQMLLLASIAFTTSGCRPQPSNPVGKWYFSSSKGGGYPLKDPNNYIDFDKNGNFKGYFYDGNLFYLVSGKWKLAYKDAGNPCLAHTDWSIVYDVNNRSGHSVENYSVSMGVFDGYLLDYWEGPDNPIKYVK